MLKKNAHAALIKSNAPEAWEIDSQKKISDNTNGTTTDQTAATKKFCSRAAGILCTALAIPKQIVAKIE